MRAASHSQVEESPFEESHSPPGLALCHPPGWVRPQVAAADELAAEATPPKRTRMQVQQNPRFVPLLQVWQRSCLPQVASLSREGQESAWRYLCEQQAVRDGQGVEFFPFPGAAGSSVTG